MSVSFLKSVVFCNDREILLGRVYRHFKGNLYLVESIAEGSEDGVLYVVYRALYGDNKLYVRPLEMFTSLVDTDKYPDATQKWRFELA